MKKKSLMTIVIIAIVLISTTLYINIFPDLTSDINGKSGIEEPDNQGKETEEQTDESEEIPEGYTRGRILEPNDREQPLSIYPHNPKKKNKQWSKQISLEIYDFIDLYPSQEREYGLEVINYSLIHLRIDIAGKNIDNLSIGLFQLGNETPIWFEEISQFEGILYRIRAQIEITEKMLTYNTEFLFTISNNGSDNVISEFYIGLSDLRIKSAWED